ncbi:tRNA pseudouridine(13) synthase TruD [Salinisphaera sp. SPP-AMP-43]|uniref:tRNA pseudouridine(13) synthase TruD n=1 Tax=Salinisphaera sp. SPP-AMP-43 TaxID=3121288 RepID=UPI003C6E0F3B
MTFLDGDRVDVAGFAYARGQAPRAHGQLRVEPADFVVEEDCPVVFDEAGEHVWLWIEKTGLTTPHLVERLSAATGVHPRYIGYSGLKDRHAVTRQWFSLAWPIKSELPAWPEEADWRILAVHRHGRKLKRGTHRANSFVIRVRGVRDLDREQLTHDAARARQSGVPNYFGPQRFGHGGRNLELARALFAGKRLSRNRRGFALSAARSLVFNAVLDARIAADRWPEPMAGDVFMLAGSQSVFAASTSAESAASLAERVAAQDIHPTGPMAGRLGSNAVVPDREAGALEQRVLAEYPDLTQGLEAARVDAERRALRLAVPDLELSFEQDDVLLRFSLPSGAFATSVLRELIAVEDASQTVEPAEGDRG